MLLASFGWRLWRRRELRCAGLYFAPRRTRRRCGSSYPQESAPPDSIVRAPLQHASVANPAVQSGSERAAMGNLPALAACNRDAVRKAWPARAHSTGQAVPPGSERRGSTSDSLWSERGCPSTILRTLRLAPKQRQPRVRSSRGAKPKSERLKFCFACQILS